MNLEEKDGGKTQPNRVGKMVGKSVQVTNEDFKTISTKLPFWTILKLMFIYVKYITDMSEENN